MARYAAVSLGVFLALSLPFALWWGEDFMFWRHLYLQFTGLGDEMYLVRNPISMGGQIGYLGFSWALTWIQLALLVTVSGVVLARRITDPAVSLSLIGVTYVLVASFSPYAVRYVYYLGLILMAVAAVVWRTEGLESGPIAHRRG